MARGREDDLVEGRKAPTMGAANRASGSAFGWQDGTEPTGAEHSLPGLHGEERLPWLHAEDDAEAGLDPGRVWGVIVAGLALLLLIAGGAWWTMHRHEGNAQLADGSVIAAPRGPIKVAPQDPGGKMFDGTGDSSFTVSQGHIPGATLAGSDQADGGAAMVVQPAPATSDSASAAATVASGQVGVQVGAFSTQLAAEAAWAHLSKSFDALSGASHRVVAGTADIGTVYGLQAVMGNAAAAYALCDRLKAAGLNCQVKD